MERPQSVEELRGLLREHAYLADRGMATALYLALMMGRPLLLEGEAGVGKTELAKAVAAALDRELIRLQCYEGIDAAQALYEWDYTRQLLHIRALEVGGQRGEQAVDEVFAPRFLVERPLLQALRAGQRAVLLVDEIDRADDEFEAFLLEFLADYQVTVPEVGTIATEAPPLVVLTSNRTRELHDALKRRCLYHWIDYPDQEREVAIIRVRAPDVPARLAASIAATVDRIRALDVTKPPGVAEAIDWARALRLLGAEEITAEVAHETLGTLLKDHDDLELVRGSLPAVAAGE